ncbi:single-strand DNA-binding protein [Actinopolyspora xinjiangensis]|uniref:Single-stranded DNA-binding protein n=1 Tax=Actinopolyspora xinjiangensis TaxID=405564 RepID=A0A1H0WB37_9ACTN|nr:single-stranded DNA-binding protein [Actinopolyspora xinjiangensis]SDP87887.1 single-strand DNA-binding protein [Actinopolyspora xinjiangensis]
MPGLPEVTVAGTLTADPEIKYLDSGVCVANFTVAANERRFDKDAGQWVDASATFLRCQLWRQEAEHAVESLSKGDRVLVTGALKQRSWETEHGEKRTVMELAVTEIGASLKFATATIRKTHRDTPTSSSGPTRASTGLSTEPPF